ncbi:Chlorovirus glycoprotein repeat domain-containing protein [Only Syngen Nebraska virus 5]|uniref:Chlorovirus glycoprotein repeat domain-containing protein n=1 Tax=Only Syngen Nebraska virus 5 TaxID=1917232 RepID=UPI00090128D7|nr:Chlorovirus glycoprotein repeat domain-containing protein [Only Syngen Nebraska virus 5]APC25597.1 Chlorovirus glycoprotein repeat domain-containing protein [Only Syngen Nebraska virus 5]
MVCKANLNIFFYFVIVKLMSYNNFKFNLQKYARFDTVTRNLIVPGNLYVDGSANIPGLQPADIAPVSTTGIIGNLLSGAYANVSGNVKATYIIGNGIYLSNLKVEIPGNIAADIIGNISGNTITVSGNVTAGFLVGNASRLTGVVIGFPSTGNADVRGNVYAPGNVNAANVTSNGIIVYENAVANTTTITGNITAPFFSGNGILLTSVTQAFPSTAAIDITGNVSAPGNVDTQSLVTGNITVGNANANAMIIQGNVSTTYFSGNASGVTGVVPSVLATNLIGNVTATGNVSASYLLGNGSSVTLNGYTIAPRGNVANQAARLLLSNAVPGTIVFQTDANVTYMLLSPPATESTNWLQFTGANFPVTSVMGRTGNVLLLSNVDVKTIGGANIASPGSLTSANISILGNVSGIVLTSNIMTSNTAVVGNLTTDKITALGNVTGSYLIGDGSLLEAVQLTTPPAANIDIVGNVVAAGNVDASNVSATTLITGNAFIGGQVNVIGNVSAGWLIGNGSTITGIPASGTQPINILGNVVSTGNVNAANITTNVLLANTMFVSGQVNVSGNVIANLFAGNGSLLTNVPAVISGTQTINIIGNVRAVGNVNAANIVANVLGAGNVIITGQVNVTGNVFAHTFIGSGSLLTSITPTLGGTQSLNIVGNVRAAGNVDAANISTRLLRATGNPVVTGQISVVGNVVSPFFVGDGSRLFGVSTVASGNQSINIIGNVVSAGNVDAANIVTTVFRANANVIMSGQADVTGNVIAAWLLGNGSLLNGIVANGTHNVNIIGNVFASGNVDASNVTTGLLRVNGNLAATGQLDITGNIVSGGFSGDGSLLQGISFASTASPLPSFVPPTTGFVSDVADTISYSNTAGWTIQLQQYTPTNIGITTYSMPINPDAPFVNLPSDVTQTLNVPWSFSNGVWSGNVRLFTLNTFSSRPVSMGYNSSYGVLGGNSSVTNGAGIQQISVNGLYSFTSSLNTTNGLFSDVWPNPNTGSLWTMILPTVAGGITILGQNFPPGQLHFVEFAKNLNYIISWHTITKNTNLTFSTPTSQRTVCHFISETEVYILFQAATSAIDPIIYNTTCTRSGASFSSVYLARINPIAQTCQWITSMYSPNTGDYSWLGMSMNPQGTMLHTMGSLRTANPGALIVANTTGSAMASVFFPNSIMWRNYGFGVFPGNGVYMNNTLYAAYSTSLDVAEGYIPTVNSDRWSADGQVMYINYAYSGSASVAMNTWAPGNTWTQRAVLTPQKTDSFNQGGAQPFIFRIPIGNVNSTWSAVAITLSPLSLGDTNPRIARIGSVTPANNGNVFLIGQSLATNTAAVTYTFGTATVNVPSGLIPSPPVVFRVQDTNGTFSNYSALIASTTDTAGRQYGTNANFNVCTTGKIPGSTTGVRTLAMGNFWNLTLNGTSAANLNTANTNPVPIMFDINSSLTVSNFRGQIPLRSFISSTPGTSAAIHYGPASDAGYNVIGLQYNGAAKMGNV